MCPAIHYVCFLFFLPWLLNFASLSVIPRRLKNGACINIAWDNGGERDLLGKENYKVRSGWVGGFFFTPQSPGSCWQRQGNSDYRCSVLYQLACSLSFLLSLNYVPHSLTHFTHSCSSSSFLTPFLFSHSVSHLLSTLLLLLFVSHLLTTLLIR